MDDIESRLLDMLTDLLLNATKRVSALEALLKERGGSFNRSTQRSRRVSRRGSGSRGFCAVAC
jgi:hypothetical protein